jgi:hypothetical protein
VPAAFVVPPAPAAFVVPPAPAAFVVPPEVEAPPSVVPDVVVLVPAVFERAVLEPPELEPPRVESIAVVPPVLPAAPPLLPFGSEEFEQPRSNANALKPVVNEQ